MQKRSEGSQRTVGTGETAVSYLLTRKRVKNVNLHIRKDGTVSVSAHTNVPVDFIDRFVISRLDFIAKAQAIYAKEIPVCFEDGGFVTVLGSQCVVEIEQGITNAVQVSGSHIVVTTKNIDKAETVYQKWLFELCREVFSESLKRLYQEIIGDKAPFPILKMRRMTSRWGSCNKQKGIITLNTRLIEKPVELIDYVAAHELCHLLRADHSKAFYAILQRFMPDYAVRRKQLRG